MPRTLRYALAALFIAAGVALAVVDDELDDLDDLDDLADDLENARAADELDAPDTEEKTS